MFLSFLFISVALCGETPLVDLVESNTSQVEKSSEPSFEAFFVKSWFKFIRYHPTFTYEVHKSNNMKDPKIDENFIFVKKQYGVFLQNTNIEEKCHKGCCNSLICKEKFLFDRYDDSLFESVQKFVYNEKESKQVVGNLANLLKKEYHFHNSQDIYIEIFYFSETSQDQTGSGNQITLKTKIKKFQHKMESIQNEKDDHNKKDEQDEQDKIGQSLKNKFFKKIAKIHSDINESKVSMKKMFESIQFNDLNPQLIEKINEIKNNLLKIYDALNEAVKKCEEKFESAKKLAEFRNKISPFFDDYFDSLKIFLNNGKIVESIILIQKKKESSK